MSYERMYSLCMILSSIFEVGLALDFYKAFHSVRAVFRNRYKTFLFGVVVCGISIGINFQNSSMLNFFCLNILYLIVCFIFVEGGLWSRIFHWLILMFAGLSSEMIFSFLLDISTDAPTNSIYENQFVMATSVFTIKLLEFLILVVIKQISKIRVKKVSGKIFGIFVIVPIGTLGIMFLLPYIRGGDSGLTNMDILILVFYLILFVGNILLFYAFTSYSQMKEEQILLRVNQTRYEERMLRHGRQEAFEQKYKEHIHNIKYYLKQIGIYLESNETDKIRNVLNQLQVTIHQEETHLICANRFLNALLIDFKEEAKKRDVMSEIFVEPGFKIEFMDDIDIVSVFGNLLDNALEAAEKCENGRVSVELYMQNDGNLVVCRIENNYNGMIIEKGDNMITTKDNPSLHGLGIRSVKKLVDKYNGYIQNDHGQGIYTVTLMFSMDKFNIDNYDMSI